MTGLLAVLAMVSLLAQPATATGEPVTGQVQTQDWFPIRLVNVHGEMVLRAQMCLDADSNTWRRIPGPGIMQIWHCIPNQPNQQWWGNWARQGSDLTETTIQTPGDPIGPPTPRCLDDWYGRITLWECNGQPQQRWIVRRVWDYDPRFGGFVDYTIVNDMFGDYLDTVLDQADGKPVFGWYENHSLTQHWFPYPI